jgi:hypothetical protein
MSIVDSLGPKLRDLGKWGSLRRQGIVGDSKDEFSFTHSAITLTRDARANKTAVNGVLSFETGSRNAMLDFVKAALKKRKLSDASDQTLLHTCFSIRVTRTNRQTHEESTGVLHIAQLAGMHGLTTVRANKPKALKQELMSMCKVAGQLPASHAHDKGMTGYLYNALHLSKTRAKLAVSEGEEEPRVSSAPSSKGKTDKQTFVLLFTCINPSAPQFANTKEVLNIVCGVRGHFRTWYEEAAAGGKEAAKAKQAALAAKQRRIAGVGMSVSGYADRQMTESESGVSTTATTTTTPTQADVEQELRELVQALKRENGSLRVQVKHHARVMARLKTDASPASGPLSSPSSSSPPSIKTPRSSSSVASSSSVRLATAKGAVVRRSDAISSAVAHSECQAQLQRTREQQQIKHDRRRLAELVLENKALVKSVSHHEDAVHRLKNELHSAQRSHLAQMEVLRAGGAATREEVRGLTHRYVYVCGYVCL